MAAIPVTLSTVYESEVILYTAALGQIAVNRRLFKLTAFSGGAPTTLDLVGGISAWVAGLWKACLSEDTRFQGARLRTFLPNVGEQWAETVADAGIGTFAVDSHVAPAQITGLMRLYTDIRGKRGEGRTFVGFPPLESLDTDSTPVVGYVAAVEALAVKYTGVQLIDFGAFTFTGSFGLSDAGPPATFGTFTSNNVPKAFATQRRRGEFGRLNTPPL